MGRKGVAGGGNIRAKALRKLSIERIIHCTEKNPAYLEWRMSEGHIIGA